MALRSASSFSGHYNPQQWGAVNNVSSNSMSVAGEHRQTSHLAPRSVGPDEPVASPPPPYSPRRDQQSQDSPRRTSEITSPADTTSPETEYSRYGTPVSAATSIMSPDIVSHRSPLIRQHTSPKESPNVVSAPSFPPPPPGQRTRAVSKNAADRLFSSLTLKAKVSKVPLSGDATDTLQKCTAQIQAFSATCNETSVHPPAARRAASTGGIGLAGTSSRSTSQTPCSAAWEPNISLPPPPPGPPPRSQSLNRPIENISSGISTALPLRLRGPPGTGTSLETVPPTPADWREEDGTNGQAPPSRDRSQGPSPLHIDTGSILRKRQSGADYPMTATAGGSAHPGRDSSTGGLFRSPAVRNRSAMGIRERRNESRNGKGRIVEDSAVDPSRSVSPWVDDSEDVRPTNLVLLASQMNASKQRMATKFTPKSGKSMQSLDGALSSPEIQKSSGKAVSFDSSYTTPQPGSTPLNLSAISASAPPFPPSRETLDQSTSVEVSPSLPMKTVCVPPDKRLSVPSTALSLIVPPVPEQRPVSHLLHMPNSDDSMQLPLTPLTKAPQEPPEDLLGPESPKLFAGRAIERHRIFAEREAAAADDSERLHLFVQYMKAESRIRREQYAPVFEEYSISVHDLTQGFFGHASTDKSCHDREQRSPSRQDTSRHTSIASSAFGDSSSQDDSSAVSRKYESFSSASSTQQQPESTYFKEEYVPCLSPIASMSIVTGQDEIDSRGRAPSRWFEDQSHSGDGLPGDAFNVLQRSKRESKYMGVPRDVARYPSVILGNIATASTGTGQWLPSEASRQPSYGPNQYPSEKTGFHETDPSSLHFLPPTPSSAPFTPDPSRLDISRLVTLPPPWPRHHPAVNNNHPELASERAIVRSLHEKEQAEIIRNSYRTQSHGNRQRADSWCKHQRSLHSQDIEFRIEHGDISQEDFDEAESLLEGKIADCEKEVTQTDFDLYQSTVLEPLHKLFSDRIKLADASLDKLSSRLFTDAQLQSPNLPQEEGDEEPELLEKLTQAKWLFEAREHLHRQLYDLLSERNNKYKDIVLLPYKQNRHMEKHAEAESFFANDAQERRFKFEQALCKRARAFLSVIENNVSRGVESQLGAFWDIAPSILGVLQKVPLTLDGFSVIIPPNEYSENPSYYDHPLQYLSSLLGHAEKSTYQFIESQINLFCLLHEIRCHALAARCKVEAQGRDASWAAEEEQRREETKLTEDLKEKASIVEGQWKEALGSELMAVRERVRGTLLEEGGWDDEGEEI